MNSVIQLEIYEKTFKKKNESLLNDFKLEVQMGEMISIVGKSGVGKSSLLNIIGLLDTDYQGSYKLFNHSIHNQSDKKLAEFRNRTLGYILQESPLIDSMNIEDNIKLPLLYSATKECLDIQNHLEQVIALLDLDSILKKTPSECSGGQKSRAAFARSIIMKPQIILADEPTAFLDSENQEKMMNVLFDMNKRFNTTIVTVTHDLELASRHDRTITIKK